MNLVGILIPGERVAAAPGRSVVFRNGMVEESNPIHREVRVVRTQRKRPVISQIPRVAIDQPAGSLPLF